MTDVSKRGKVFASFSKRFVFVFQEDVSQTTSLSCELYSSEVKNWMSLSEFLQEKKVNHNLYLKWLQVLKHLFICYANCITNEDRRLSPPLK